MRTICSSSGAVAICSSTERGRAARCTSNRGSPPRSDTSGTIELLGDERPSRARPLGQDEERDHRRDDEDRADQQAREQGDEGRFSGRGLLMVREATSRFGYWATRGVQELDQSARRSGRWLSIARHGAPRSRGPGCSGRASSRRRWADLWRIVRDPRGEGVRRDPDLLERVVGDPHLLHRPLSLRCVIDGRRGGLASTISTQPARWESTARRRPPRGAVGRRPPCRRAAARSHPSRGS